MVITFTGGFKCLKICNLMRQIHEGFIFRNPLNIKEVMEDLSFSYRFPRIGYFHDILQRKNVCNSKNIIIPVFVNVYIIEEWH